MRKNKNKAFTIIEAVVSLGVMMIVMGMGAAGIVAFKNSVELQNSYSDLVSVIRTMQNQAKNGLAVGFDETGKPLIPKYYVLDFTGGDNGSVSYQPLAAAEDGILYSIQTNNDFPVIKNITIETDSTCKYIGFEYFSTNIVSNYSSGDFTVPINSGICEIRITHSNISTTVKKITLNVEKNQITFN